MNVAEPKVGDAVHCRGWNSTIDRFVEDDEVLLRNGRRAHMSDFEQAPDGAWTPQGEPHTYMIGETYRASSLREGVSVVRPAVLEGALGPDPRVVTTSPCCVTEVRRLNHNDISSAMAQGVLGSVLEQCRYCKAHYRVSLVHTGRDVRLGLYGACWMSRGF